MRIPTRLALLPLFGLFTSAAIAAPGEIYVDPVNGKDTNTGTAPDQAFATIGKSRDTIRAQKLSGATVSLRGGRYELKETLLLDDRDSDTTYRAYSHENPIISGGRRVTGWKQVPGKPYWQASVPVSAGFTDWFWQLYVNGVRAERARSNTPLIISDYGKDNAAKDGFNVKPERMRAYTNIEDIRCLWVHVFKGGDIPVSSITGNEFTMQQPAWDIWKGWKDGALKTREFFVVNAFEELDEPGEWYLNRKTRAIYYYPFKRDDMNTAEIYAPVLQGIVKVSGAHDLRIDGITFEHGQWLDPQHKLLGRSQAEIYMGDTKTYSGELPGQIILDHATNVVMSGCTVRHMGSCGVQVYEDCHRVTIEGNTCHDTTAAGITVGKFWVAQEQCPANTVSTDILVANNIVRDTGRDYPQGTGINIFAAQRCLIYHNDVSDTSYTGIHARIGDSGKVNPAIGQIEYKYNKVSLAFQDHKWGIDDGGHIYMHGRYPGSVVSENYSLHASHFINNEYYSDNWSHTVLWSKNICRDTKAKRPFWAWHGGNVGVVFDGNYSDKPNGNIGHAEETNLHIIKNGEWPEEARRIMANAGLEPKWRYLNDTVYGHENLAQGKPSTGAAAVDNDWNSNYVGQGPWQVDLGARYVIRRITILPQQKGYEEDSQRNLEVLASNDADFKQFVVLCEQNEVPWYHKSGPASNMWEQYIPVMPGYRYLRLKSTNPAAKIGFAEFSAYGYPEKTK